MELSREAAAPHCFEMVSEDSEPSTTCNGGLEEPTTMVTEQPGAVDNNGSEGAAALYPAAMLQFRLRGDWLY